VEVEIDFVDRSGDPFALAVAVDEEQARAADALDRRDLELTVAASDFDIRGAEFERACVRRLRVLDPEGHGAGAGAVRLGIILGVTAGLGIDDEVAVALL